jgi:hypothetical protein
MASLFADRLRGLAMTLDRVHLRLDRGAIRGDALEDRIGEDQIVGGIAVAIAETHIAVAQHAPPPLPVDGVSFGQAL